MTTIQVIKRYAFGELLTIALKLEIINNSLT